MMSNKAPGGRGPITWGELSTLIASQNLEQLSRREDTMRNYQYFKANIIYAEYESVTDYLLCSIFGYEASATAEGRKRACSNKLTDCVVWRINDFPYHFDWGMDHYVLWSTRELQDDDIHRYVRLNLSRTNLQGEFPFEYQFFQNPPELRSVPDIWHVHVIVKSNP